MSADPLGVHEPGEADWNLYAYVGGQALKAIDPLGLDEAQEARAPMAAEGSPATGINVNDANYIDNFTRATWDPKTNSITLAYTNGQTATANAREIIGTSLSHEEAQNAIGGATYRGEGIATPTTMNYQTTPRLWELRQRIENLVGWQLIANTSYLSFQVLSTATGAVLVQQWNAAATTQAIARGSATLPRAAPSSPMVGRAQHDVALTVRRHTLGGSDVIRDLRKGKEAHVFSSKVDLDATGKRVLAEGKYQGEIAGWHRWSMRSEGVGTRVQAGKPNVTLNYVELKGRFNSSGDFIYHLDPRTGPRKP